MKYLLRGLGFVIVGGLVGYCGGMLAGLSLMQTCIVSGGACLALSLVCESYRS